MTFLSEQGERMLFPRPMDGAMVEITPPGLAWLPAEGASGYRVEIRDGGGSLVYEKAVGSDPVHLPDRVLEPGTYTWDVAALDAQGNEAARRGKQSFTIAEGVPELSWVEPEALLSRAPEGHSRLIYLRRDLPGIRATLETTRRQSWQTCLKAAERALDVPAPAYPTYHEIEDPTECRLAYRDYYRGFGRYIDSALIDLSLAFLITEEAKYAEAARRILLEVADWPTDDEDVTSVSAKWGDEPGLHLSRCAHRAYDWLYDALSEDERAADAAETRIGAAMGVYGPEEAFELEALEMEGWFGARATGAFGMVEGWAQLVPGALGPDGYGDTVAEGRGMICGTAADGERFAV